MEEHEDVLETDNTEAACGEKKHNVTSLAVPPCDIVSAGGHLLCGVRFFATHSREYCVGRACVRVLCDAFPGLLRQKERKSTGRGLSQASESRLGASLSGGIVV